MSKYRHREGCLRTAAGAICPGCGPMIKVVNKHPKRCKHELVVGTCATCLGTDGVSVPDPFEGIKVEELDPEKDLGGKG